MKQKQKKEVSRQAKWQKLCPSAPIPKETHTRLKAYAVANGIKLYKVVDMACTAYLDAQGF